MFRQLKGRGLREAAQRENAKNGGVGGDQHTDDLNGFPKYMPDFDQQFPLTGPCNAYDRDEADSN